MSFDLSNAWKSASRIVNEAITLLPNMALAIVIFGLFLLLAFGAKSIIRRFSRQRQWHKTLGLLLGQLVQVSVSLFGALVAFSVVAPSFTAGDIVKMLGVGSVAIGFAFQNILQNFLAGIILLLQEPFQIGDNITVTGLTGKVEDIQTRATIIIGAEGQRILIPNAVIFTNPLIIEGTPSGNPAAAETAQKSS